MTCIYLLSDGSGYYKIGRTAGLISKRIAELQTGNPRKISIVSCIWLMEEMGDGSIEERCMHAWMDKHRGNGGTEWFELNDERLTQVINELCALEKGGSKWFTRSFLIPVTVEKLRALIGDDPRSNQSLNEILEWCK